MSDFLIESFSPQRFEAYMRLANKKGERRSPEELYALNLQYSKELYVVLAGLEITVRNKFHQACMHYSSQSHWFLEDILQAKHRRQVDDAMKNLNAKNYKIYIVDDIVAQLNYGFWVNLCNRPYDGTLWRSALYKCFPALGHKPKRKDIRDRLERTLQLRNKIAHLEPILKQEHLLIQEYRNILELLYALCPQTQEWFEGICNFQEVWDNRFKEKP